MVALCSESLSSLRSEWTLSLRAIEEFLAEKCDRPWLAMVLLHKARFPRQYTPRFDNPSAFWVEIVQLANDGALPGGVQPIVEAARKIFRWNPRLKLLHQKILHQSQSLHSVRESCEGNSLFGTKLVFGAVGVPLVLGLWVGFGLEPAADSSRSEVEDAPVRASIAKPEDANHEDLTPAVRAIVPTISPPLPNHPTVDATSDPDDAQVVAQASPGGVATMPITFPRRSVRVNGRVNINLEAEIARRSIREIRAKCGMFFDDEPIVIEVLIDVEQWRPAETALTYGHQERVFEDSLAHICVERALRRTFRELRGKGRMPGFLKLSL